ncbi:hypothetical protein P3T76_009178 [Phytophthora citrophthora]|uniref:Uncharacterized protein n=1 Tax=Phytophthora citrophthora TaxID=4793 RepID=A0AAD9GH49_9STRA|nr:hypothetical protein P3T76_009178 [Phytophthora citrophthora]
MALSVFFSFNLSLLLFNVVQGASLSMYNYDYGHGDHMRQQTNMGLDFYAPADRGCAMCRNGENCTLAVHNQSEGVFCGDVLSTFQPCCCSFRNECMTTIFSDSCECFDGAREEEIMTTRFYLFVGLSLIAWGLLAYDKMCAGPYKVMNSNHQLLASSPSAARARGEDSVVDTVDSDSDDDRDNGTAITTSVTTMAVAATVAVDIDEDTGVDDDTTPLRPTSSSPGEVEADSADIEVSVASIAENHSASDEHEDSKASIQSV